MNPKVVNDMTSLHHIHEAGILHNLRERSKLEDQRPYTFMANVLVAVNPLRPQVTLEGFESLSIIRIVSRSFF